MRWSSEDGAISGDAPMTTAPAGSGQSAEGRGRLVTVLGGTGFLGRRVVRHLLDRGFRVRAVARHPERVPPLFGPNEVGVEAVGLLQHHPRVIRLPRSRVEWACGRLSG